MKILNLYAGIGGNRKLWEGDITAVEFNPEIAKIYQDLYPNDTVIVGDAHQYLLDHYKEFDFIWSSPPCQSHSSFRHNICVRFRGTEPKYPDMKLYEEIIFLKHHSICPYVVENVKPYYEPLIPGKLIQRHLFWSNFDIPDLDIKKDNIRTAQIADLEAHHGFDLSKYKLPNKRQILRNCVYPQVGLHVLNSAPLITTYRGLYPQILKAMREYAKYQVERQYEKLYQEAKENVEFQYKQEEIIEAQKIKKYMLEHSITK